MSSWKKPGASGALLYTVLAGVVGTVVAFISRLQVERQRGRREAAKRLPDGAIIVISNHTSYADGVLLALAGRRLGRSLRLLATSGVFKAPLIGFVARRLGFIPVQRGTKDAAQALDGAAAALAAGEAVGLYPEGRLTRDPRKWPERAKTGAVRLALRSGAPIVPLAMDGAHHVVREQRLLLNLIANVVRRPKVRTAVGDPIDVSRMLSDLRSDHSPAEATPEEIRTLSDRVMEQLVDLVEELRGEDSPHPAGVPRMDDAPAS